MTGEALAKLTDEWFENHYRKNAELIQHLRETMANRSKGWAILDDFGINIRSVSDTKKTAIINWLVVERRVMIFDNMSNEEIMALWEAHHGSAKAVQIEVVENVQP